MGKTPDMATSTLPICPRNNSKCVKPYEKICTVMEPMTSKILFQGAKLIVNRPNKETIAGYKLKASMRAGHEHLWR